MVKEYSIHARRFEGVKGTKRNYVADGILLGYTPKKPTAKDLILFARQNMEQLEHAGTYVIYGCDTEVKDRIGKMGWRGAVKPIPAKAVVEISESRLFKIIKDK